jgi:hypothetical protein
MSRRTIGVAILLLTVFCQVRLNPTIASESPQEVFKLLDKLGLRRLLEQQQAEQQRRSREQMDQFYADLVRQNPGIPPQYMNLVKESFQQGILRVINSYSVDEALAVYAEVLAHDYPGTEIQHAERQLSSPEGERLARTLNEAMAATYNFRSQRIDVVSKREIQEILARFREAMAEVERKSDTGGVHN